MGLKLKGFEELFAAVKVVEGADTKELYEDLVKTMEEWIQTVDVYGKVKVALFCKNTPRDGTIAVFDFSNKKFEVRFTGFMDQEMWFFVDKAFSPYWFRDFIKVLHFLANIDKVISKLREENQKLENNLEYLIKLVKKLRKDLLPKFQSIEDKLVSEAITREALRDK